uniref:Uncharacterized protein n=1 Tax=Nelumbo nucifera TaxID=4432 RepID=A0A822YNW1_NELNU|nr:TPA_asm: hypothetical protein HUJ06_006524 [Nelumbo nucifera]
MESNKKVEEVGIGYSHSSIKKARLQSTLSALLDDPILADIPKKPTLTDVDTLISLELGSAMRISVLKMDGTTFGGMCGQIFVSPTIMRSSLMITPCFRFMVSVITLRSTMFPLLCHGCLGDTPGGESTGSFMVLAKDHD